MPCAIELPEVCNHERVRCECTLDELAIHYVTPNANNGGSIGRETIVITNVRANRLVIEGFHSDQMVRVESASVFELVVGPWEGSLPYRRGYLELLHVTAEHLFIDSLVVAYLPMTNSRFGQVHLNGVMATGLAMQSSKIGALELSGTAVCGLFARRSGIGALRHHDSSIHEVSLSSSTLLSPLDRWWTVEELLMHESQAFEICPGVWSGRIVRFRDVLLEPCDFTITQVTIEEERPLVRVVSILLASAGRDTACVSDPELRE